MRKFIISLGLSALFLFASGCFMPAITYCKGNVGIYFEQNGIESASYRISEKFILVSFWEYPTVNGSPGKIVISKVIVSETNQLMIDFPLQAYWVVWTPVLGFQHMAPEPGVVVFHHKYPPGWDIGGTSGQIRICCAKPETQRPFIIPLGESDERLSCQQGRHYYARKFLTEFLAQRKKVLRKVDGNRDITAEEKSMVRENIAWMQEMLDKIPQP